MLRRVFFLSMLFSALAQPVSADQAFVGLTGLGEMRTPETVGERQQASVAFRYKQVGENIGRRISPQLGYTYGFGKDMEAGVLLPFHSMEGGSSLGRIPLLYKYRFYDSELLKFAGTALVDLPTASKDKGFGTGSLGFGAEADGSVSFGDLDLVGSLNWAKGDYCPGCDYGGVQRGPDPVYIPIFKLAGGVAYGREDYRAYAELHFENAANGNQAGQVAGDADLYALIGGRYQVNEPLALGGYAGAGLSGTKSNTKALVSLMAHYTFGGETGEAKEEAAAKAAPAGKAAPAVAKPGAVKIEVVDACSLAEPSKQLVAKIAQKGLEARFTGSASQRMSESAIYFTEAGVAAGSEVARLMEGKQKMVKQQSLPGGAAVRVYVGCDYGAPAAPKAAPAAPVAPKKEKSAINLAVVNGCGKPGLAEDAAKTLLLGGYNVTQIFDEPKPTTPGLTEVRFREQYKDEAADIAAKLPGRQRLFVDRSLAADVDIRVTIGCAQ